MKNILLTGATGFLGSHLLESFLLHGYSVAIIKRSTSDTWRINHLLANVKSYDVDKTSLETIFKEIRPRIIVHTACSYGRNNETLVEVVNSNLIFGLQLMEEGIKSKARTFINTDSLLPRNINDYSLSKAQLSDWLKMYQNKIQVVNLKIEHMYGPKDDSKKFLPWLINEMVNGTTSINLTSGFQKRDFIYIDDVVAVFNLIANNRTNLGNWNEFDVGTNVFTPVKDFVLSIAKELKRANRHDIESRLNFGSVAYRDNEIMIPNLDNSKLLELGWIPKISIIEGVQKILK
jgi:CDP-paratose synthetase